MKRLQDLLSENWLVLEELVKVLQPFEIVTVVLSKETKYFPVNCVTHCLWAEKENGY